MIAQLWQTTNGGCISKLQRKRPVSEAKETLQCHLANEKLVGLPEWSWDEVNERVQRGVSRKLIVGGVLVFNEIIYWSITIACSVSITLNATIDF